MFKDKETLSTSIGVDNEVILKYINETLNGVIPDKYSKTEGRIMKTIGQTLSEDIKIIHTNDVHCGVQDSIGYDGLMLYKKQLLTRYENVILVDAGDHIQGGTIGLISNGLAIIDIMNKIGYDVATLGNHEFDYGVAQLEECAKELKCGYISSNYCFHKNKTSIYPAYKIIDVNGKKIAFIGVATPQTISKTYLITVTDEHGDLVYDFLTENHSQELFTRIQSHIDKVRNEGANYVIIVAHLGVDGDALEENTSKGLLNHLKNVDALIDGHTHLIYQRTAQDLDGKNVPFAQTGTKLGVIGVFTIHTNGSITHENIDAVPYESVIDGDSLKVTRNKKEVWVDVNMYEYIKSTINSFSNVLNEVVGKTSFPLNVYKIGTVDKQSHNQLSRRGENAFCNLVADGMRILAGADVTILNAGSVREDINEGDITYQEVINTMPFSNDIYTKEITGQAILDSLEFGVRTLPNATSRFPQVSGITYKIDISIDSSVVVDKDEIFERVSGERRVYDVKINGEDLNPRKTYSIAGSSFILEGGDGYSMFASYDITKMSIGVDNEVLLKYIKETLKGVIPDQYKMTEGRILKTQGKSLNQDIKIIHTNDVHCGVQDSIGYDGLMLYKKQLLTKYENVILVDAGDHIQGGTMGLVSNGLAIIDIMNKVGYDVATLGNHEFDYGVAQLEECAKELKCGYISTNYCLHKDKKAIYPAYKIIEKGGKKIAFIGVATPQTLSKTSLVTIRDENGEPVYDFLTENHSKELFERVQQQIDIVKSEGADYVIIVAHLGIDGDALEENTSRGLLNNLNGVDALIDGHTHLIYERTTKGKDNKDVLFAQTGTKLNVIGVFTIHTDGSITHENIEEVPYNADLYSDSLNITRNKKERWVDTSMYEYIIALQNSYSETLNRVIGKTDFLLNVYAEGTVIKQSHAQLSRKGENAFCNLVADGIRTLGEADVTILNAGSVRDDILAGDITYQDVLNVMPFSNDIYTKEITGQAILDALEFGVRTLPDSTSRFPQVSGITYKIDISIDSSVVVDSDEIFIKVAGKRRVYDVKINGEKLDLLKTYSIAGSSFILEGGDGYSMFAPFEITKTSIGVDNEVLLKYITENLKGVIPLQYKTVEGRIVQTQGRTYDSGSSTDNNSVKYLKKFGNILSILLTLILL